MNKAVFKRGLLLTGLLAGVTAFLFLQRLFLPLWARFVAAGIVELGAIWLFFVSQKPERPFALARWSFILITIESWAFFIGLHGFILKDLSAPGLVPNHIYVNGLAMIGPFVVAFAWPKRGQKANSTSHNASEGGL